MVVHAVPSGDVWSWNALPYAASQLSTTWLMACVPPRSTWIHCGSLNPLDQRVPVFPSTAFAGPRPAFSLDDEVAGWPWDSRVPLPPPPIAVGDGVGEVPVADGATETSSEDR